MSYNIVASVPGKVILEGESLEKVILDKALSIVNEYAGLTEVAVATHTINTEPKNILKYIPFSEFRKAVDLGDLQLVDLDLSVT